MVNLIYHPSVYVVGKTSLSEEAIKAFGTDNGFQVEPVINPLLKQTSPDALPEFAGRVCYMSFDKGRPSEKYIGHILEVGHGSVLEHSNITLAITGVSRSLTHELVRHRAGFAFSQLSQRFVDESNVSFVVPPAYIGNFAHEDSLRRHLSSVVTQYQETVGKKLQELTAPDSLVKYAIRGGFMHDVPTTGTVIEFNQPYTMTDFDDTARTKTDWVSLVERNPELATKLKLLTYSARKKTALESCRSVLPNCTETKIVVTANMRAWRHFIHMRGSIHADLEIRRLACKIADLLKAEAPLVFQDVTVKNDAGDGRSCVHVTHPKV